METSHDDLIETFRDMLDEELLGRWRSGTLSEEAHQIVRLELRRRGFDPEEALIAKATRAPGATPADAPPSEPVDAADMVEVTHWETIARFGTPIEAHVLRTHLESEGIPVVILDEYQFGAFPGMPGMNPIDGVRVQVPAELRALTESILAATKAGVYELEPEARGDPAPGTVCPRCGGTRAKGEGLPLLQAIFAIVTGRARPRLRCTTCQHVWNGPPGFEPE